MTILLVEDNEINVLIANKLLSRWSVKLEVANNGQVAVDKVQNYDYDLVLMDLHMPVMDGLEATHCIRHLPEPHKRDVPIIALTASAIDEERDAMLSAGMNDHIIKPIDLDRLSEVIAKYLKSDVIAE